VDPAAPRPRFIDLYVLRLGPAGLELLALRRAPGVRCAGAWESVHGRIEDGETAVQAALRELDEETGLAVGRLYNLSRVESFYLHAIDQVVFIPVFAAFVRAPGTVRLSPEHDAHEWLTLEAAAARLAWPRERRALRDLALLLGGGTAGPLEDVLRIPPP
jgi:dihydroneopterin triphosphate diphosphatase